VRHHVFLVPGFFGFANLGEFYYFQHLADELEACFKARGVDALVTRVTTHPTGAISVRARRLYECLERVAGKDDDPIHVIGHSAGGLDARLLLARPTHDEALVDVDRFVARTRSVITVASPHRGTPLASFFNNRLGAPMLRALSIITLHMLRFGHVPVKALLGMAAGLTKVHDKVGLDQSFFDQIFKDLLGDFSADRRDEVSRFFAEVGEEQTLVAETTPEAMTGWATAGDRTDVRRASVVTRARRPGISSVAEVGLNPYQQATHALFAALYRETERHDFDVEQLGSDQRDALLARWPDLHPKASDGVVPTLSQPWGEIIGIADADHHDVIGHFPDPSHVPPHVDWLATSTGFSRERFTALWEGVADWMLQG
jgi:triacylglycerol lipase